MTPAASSRSRAERLVLVTMALAFVHHLDHVLRVVHSGWPFIPEVTEFTYSLLIYPVLALVLWVRAPRLRIGLSVALAVFLTVHAVFEPYNELYIVWSARPEWNWLAASSPTLAVVFVLVTVLVPAAAVAAAMRFIRSGGV